MPISAESARTRACAVTNSMGQDDVESGLGRIGAGRGGRLRDPYAHDGAIAERLTTTLGPRDPRRIGEAETR